MLAIVGCARSATGIVLRSMLREIVALRRHGWN
jgi:hypothetical protein